MNSFFIHPMIEPVRQLIAIIGTQNPGYSLQVTGNVIGLLFTLPFFVLLTRLLAEMPGRRYGNCMLWWVIFLVAHIYGLIGYLIYDKVIARQINDTRTIKKIELVDTSRRNIESVSGITIDLARELFPEITVLIDEGKLEKALDMALEFKQLAIKRNARRTADVLDFIVLYVRNEIDGRGKIA